MHYHAIFSIYLKCPLNVSLLNAPLSGFTPVVLTFFVIIDVDIVPVHLRLHFMYFNVMAFRNLFTKIS